MLWYTSINIIQRSAFSSTLSISHNVRRYGSNLIVSKIGAHPQTNCMNKQSFFKLCGTNRGCAKNVLIQRSPLNTSPLEVDTNVAKDVILYRYDNPKFFRNLNFFAVCQFCFWSYLSHFAYTTLKDAPVPKEEDENLPWWRKINLGENKYRNILTIISFLIGYGILTAAWIYTLKSVRYVILRKGGKQVTFITYTPYGHNRMITVDLSKVSSQESRQNARVHLPVKIKNLAFHYMIDMRGEFKNPALFDLTVGLYRPWKKKK